MRASILRLILLALSACALCQNAAADTPVSSSRLTLPIRESEPPLDMYAHVTSRVLSNLIHRTIDRKEYVVESILSLTTRGTAHAECQVGLELVPNDSDATVRFLIDGRATINDTLGTMRSVRIRSSSRTQISAFKDLVLNAQGLRPLPTRAECQTVIQVNDVDAPRRLVEWAAWRRIGRMQPQAEDAASERAARRAEQQLDEEFNVPLNQLQEKYVQNLYLPLERKQALPDIRLATTRERLSITVPTPGRQSDGIPAPRSTEDLSLCIRDDFINRLAQALLSGQTITDHQWAELMHTLTGVTPRPLWVHARSEPWSVTAARQRFLQLAFEGETIQIALLFESVTRGQVELVTPIKVSVAYSLDITPDGPRLTRAGDLAVEHADRPTTNHSTNADDDLRQFLYRKFAGVFPAELTFDGLVPPAGGFWGRLRQLELVQLSSRDAWFALGYRWTPSTTSTAASNPAR